MEDRYFWYITITPDGRDPEPSYFSIVYHAGESTNNPGNGPPLTGWRHNPSGEISSKRPAPTLTVLDENTGSCPKQHKIPQVSIIQPTASAYEKLLLSEDFSDVKLACEGEILPAHKNVLAASSSFFHSVFSGQWNENESGQVTIAHPSELIKTVLKAFYTGHVDMSAINQDPIRFLSIANQFDLPWLKQVAEETCSYSINKNTLKAMWQAARLYDCSTLKRRCIDFAKENLIAVWRGMAVLQVEDEPSWDEFLTGMEMQV